MDEKTTLKTWTCLLYTSLYRMCTKTFTWRLLTGPELTEVYLNEMRRDFPCLLYTSRCV